MKITHSPLDEGHWVGIPNRAARDHRLSWRARGLLVELLSYPDGWKTSVDRLVEIASSAGGASEGRDSMRSAMKELIAAGYVRRVRYSEKDGKWATEVEVSDCSDRPTEIPSSDNQASDIPASADQSSLRRRTRKTDTKKDLIRDEGMDGQEPEPGSGRGTRIGDPEIGVDPEWPVVAPLGAGFRATETVTVPDEVWAAIAPHFDH